MKRDLELSRRIMLAIEQSEHGYAPEPETLAVLLGCTSEYELERLGYHMWLLMDAGLARGADASLAGDHSPRGVILSLTSSGHEFCEIVRNEEIWEKGMQLVADGESIPFEVLLRRLIEIAVDHFTFTE